MKAVGVCVIGTALCREAEADGVMIGLGMREGRIFAALSAVRRLSACSRK